MITVSIVTRPHFSGSTSNLRYDSERIIATALGIAKPADHAKNTQVLATSIHPANPREIGSVDALVLIGVSGMISLDDERIALGNLIHNAITEIHPGLRITVHLSFDLKVGRFVTNTPIAFSRELQTIRTDAVARVVEELKRLRAPKTKAS